MGAAATQPVKDQVSSVSPWNTQVVVDNQCTTPVRVYLARDSDEPTVKNSIDHSVPPQASYAIHSGWLKEPLATLIVRVGVHEAKVFRMPHMAQLKVELAPSGLKVTSEDQMIVEDFWDPGSVPNNDTVPMVLRGESFLDRKPSLERRAGIARQTSVDLPAPIMDRVSSMSPWSTQVVVDNQCTTPLRVFLARNPNEPTVENSIDHSVPPQASYAIRSGWMNEPLASLILRVGVHEAKVFRLPHMTQLKVELGPSGLKVTSNGPMGIEDYPDPGSVPNNDTVPMTLREESFLDRRPGSQEVAWRPGMSPSSPTRTPVVVDLSSSPPSTSVRKEVPPQFSGLSHTEEEHSAPEPTVHGKPVQESVAMGVEA